ncbi:Syntaxin-like protein psy1 [Termitomyces sp. J132]|nr:Syntaxin-like protein psy1 [Termitomyces sp. J132]
MSKDRLAAARAQRQQQVATASHEMTNLGISEPSGLTSANVSSIQEGIEHINSNVHQIAALHSRLLNVLDESQTRDAAQLDQLATETRTLNNNVKERLRALERAPLLGPDAQMRRNRISFVRLKFLDAIQNYQRVEQDYRTKSRQRVERQLKIGMLKPDATQEEVTAAVEGGGQQIFAQALTTSSRYGESRTAYREVQERQVEIKKMEETLAELAQLFNDASAAFMSILIEQQEEIIGDVEKNARIAEQDVQKGHDRTHVESARSYRKARWICFGIFLIIIAIIAIVLGVEFGAKKH